MAITLNDLAQTSLEDACQALLPSAPDTASSGDASLCRAAVLGFAGDKVQGTLGIAASQTGLMRVFRNGGGTGEWDSSARRRAEDSLGELSNLVLGHLKRAWLRRDIEITLATPLVIRGLSIEVRGGDGNCWATASTDAGSDRITAWLDLHCDQGMEVSEEIAVDIAVEGEPLLF